jgi:hypothetical protein
MKKTALRSGTHVRHAILGDGTVKEQWGSFMACKVCHDKLRQPIGGVYVCHCGKVDRFPEEIIGEDVYEVDFGGAHWSINRCWLTT